MSLFGSHKTVTPQYTGLQVQTSSSALPIPIVWGVNRLAPNVIWYGNFQKHAVQDGGKGGGGSSSYIYSASLELGLCEGSITGLGNVFKDRGLSTLAQLNLSLLTGTTPQAPWTLLSALYPSQALAYAGTALAVSPSFDLGSSASIGSIAFEVYGRFSTSGGGGDPGLTFGGILVGGQGNASVLDADPALVIGDFLTNAQYGAGFPPASISAATLYGTSGDGSYQTYCQAMSLALSPCLTDQESANSTLARWLQLTNATAVWSGGLLKFIPFGDAPVTGTLASGTTVGFVPNMTPVYDLDDDDFLHEDDADPVRVTRSDPHTASNVQRVEILNRAPTYAAGAPAGTPPAYYAPTPIEARDQNAIELYGLKVGSTVTAHEICDPKVGAIAAQLILQRGLYVRNSYAFRLSWEYCLLEPMDVVTLTDAGLGLAATPVRIVAIEEDADGLLSVTAEEFPGTVATTTGYAVDSAAGAAFDRAVVPAAVNPPVILEPPSDLTGGQPQLWLGLSGGTAGVADPNWGGATIYASSDNATYTQVGTMKGPCRQGVLAMALAAPPGGIGDTATISFAESGAAVLAGAAPILFVIDGEIMSFTSASLVAAGTYRLGGLKRALYGKWGGAHAVGAQTLILDKAAFTYPLPFNLIGKPLWFKFASFNIFGGAQQDLSTCTAYQVTPVGSGYFGPASQAIAAGTSLDEGLASAVVSETDDDGLVSDPYTEAIDMGLASAAPQTASVQAGGTGASTAAGARTNIGAAASGANTDITSLTNLVGVGIGAPVDAGNKLAVKSAAVLFDNAGAGMQATINKAGASDSGTIAYQTGTSGRALAGLLGSDRYRVSVSAAGSAYKQALDVDPATGNVGLAGYTADATNALGVLGTNFLFAASADSCRFGFSKAAAANDASLSFQTNYSARALAGLLGSDAFQLKVSPDGASFYQVFVTDSASGNAAFKALLSVATYNVASLPTGLNGALAFAANGRKVGEAAGAGTGVVVAFSNGQWRRLSDDSIVAA